MEDSFIKVVPVGAGMFQISGICGDTVVWGFTTSDISAEMLQELWDNWC